MLVRPYLLPRRTTTYQCLRPPTLTTLRHFHPSPTHEDDSPTNHYDTLSLTPTATPAEIKKRFYTLSKSNHPDLHPNDPDASARFVRISEAYATLGYPDKRARYDRDVLRSSPQHAGTAAGRAGSYSSASTPAGGRPASGLSRRRTQFRGPPPSFYRSGGWGAHADKRSEHAGKASHAYESTASTTSSADPGVGPGGINQGFDDVPHFDHRGHYNTHSSIERTRHRARRKGSEAGRMQRAEDEYTGSSTGWGFFTLCGVLVATVGVPVAAGSIFWPEEGRRGRRREG